MKKRQNIRVNKARSFKEARDFDIKFWRNAGAYARFIAAWSIIKDYFKMRGENASKLRLRRSVQNIERL